MSALTAPQLATDVDLALAEAINFDMIQCGWVVQSDDVQRFAARLFGAQSDCLSVVVEDTQVTVREFIGFAQVTETIFRGPAEVIVRRAAKLAAQILDDAQAAR